MQACGVFKKDNEEALLIFENVLQNGKDRLEEALLKGTVLKTRSNKSRQTLFAIGICCFGIQTDVLEMRLFGTWKNLIGKH